MALVTPSEIADRLGRDLTEAEQRQVPLWIEDAEWSIQLRMGRLGVTAVDAETQRWVIAKAVAAMAQKPDNSTQVRVAVDDGSVSRSYASSTGQVSILDEWWDALGLTLPVSDGWSGGIAYRR